MSSPEMLETACEVLVVGASAGGVAAALAAGRAGVTVCLLEESDWIGGQLTAQGVCTPDENDAVETAGCTRLYARFREAVREHYIQCYTRSAVGRAQRYFNPGSCWVSGLSYDPRAGVQALSSMLAPLEQDGTVRLLTRTRVTGCTMDSGDPNRVASVAAQHADGGRLRIRAAIVLDATDTGELLPMCGLEGEDWVIGAESAAETSEPDAQPERRPDWVQPLTFPFPVDWSPATAETNTVAPPEDYAALREVQRYHIKHGAITGLFTGRAPWWTYRRILAAENFDDPRIPADLAMINTAGNDFYGGNILGVGAGTPEQQAETLARARRAALGYLYWLQTECPREDGDGTGYPEFRLRTDIFRTADGCAPKPYIRESRRIRSLRPILEQEIVVRDFAGRPCRGDRARAAEMSDSIGIGHYALDIHPNGHGEPNHFVATRPFQIPLGALIPVRLSNLLPACKNIGTTHLTNGAYRLHPIEWNIGESAGALAAFAVQQAVRPEQVYTEIRLRARFQRHLIGQGVPLTWFADVPLDHPDFEPIHTLAVLGVPLGRETDLLFRPDEPISNSDWSSWRERSQAAPAEIEASRAGAARFLFETLVPE